MKPHFFVYGHSLFNKALAQELFPKLFKEHRAFCSCGAWCDLHKPYDAKMWHDEHKIEVLRSRGELEEE